MRVLPRDKAGKINFCHRRLARWAERADAIGTTPEAVAELQALTQSARDALAAQYRAQRAAQAATAQLNESVAKMAAHASSIILRIRAHAIRNPRLYSEALISPPRKKSPIAAPGTPYDFRTHLCVTGALNLTWQCRNPRGAQGTMYRVWRRIDGGEQTYLGILGERKFTDDTLPARTASIIYMIQAERSTTHGPLAQFNVNFGTNGHRIPTVVPRGARPPQAA